MLIVPDTNLLISGFAYPNGVPGKIISAWRHNKIKFTVSYYILDEFERVMKHLDNKPFSDEEIRELKDILIFFADVITPEESEVLELKDTNDKLILGTLVASNADFLITGDKHLLALSEMFPIIKPRTFWDRFGF